jgi:hypothetical protein
MGGGVFEKLPENIRRDAPWKKHESRKGEFGYINRLAAELR